jgi:tRNA nucleotidyltransferase (CCA-adding enzyme)
VNVAKFPELQKHLEDMLSPQRLSLLRRVAKQARALDLPLYLVGGVVRDLYLDRPAVDFDLVVEGDAIRLARALVDKHSGRLTVHSRFGTAQWFLPDSLGTDVTGFSTLDLISARSETYRQPAALPTVHPGSFLDDLHRRDFSINTLALRLDGDHFGELHDELGGLEDLQHGRLRVLHPRSFIDDPTRLFRLVRYEQRYGLRIAPQTLALIPEALPGIKLLSAERVRHELDLVLEENDSSAMLQHLAELGILAAVHPALEWNESVRGRFLAARPDDRGPDRLLSRRLLGWSLWLMGISRGGLVAVDKRLHFEAHTRAVLLAASALWADRGSLSGKKPSQYVARLDKIPLAAVRSICLALPPGPVRRNLSDYLEIWRYLKSKTNGNDLKAIGLPTGPSYQTILHTLRNAWLDGKVKTVEQEKRLLDELVKRTNQSAKPGLKRP